MAFINTPRFPECVSLGALSKPRYKTTIVQTLSGYKSTNIEWAQPLHSFEFAKVLNQTQHESLLAFFHAVQGMGNQFRVKDPGDYSTVGVDGTVYGVLLGLSANDQVVAGGSFGTGYGRLLAGKKYIAGSLTTYRYLQKLVSGTVSVYRNSTLVVEGLGLGQITIDHDTGVIQFEHDQDETITTHVTGAQHIINLNAPFSPNITPGKLVYVTGVSSGTAAPLLNGIAHEAVAVSGAQITLDLDTSGLTAGGGTAELYAQASESLVIIAEFDVPCSFSSDEASFEILNKTLAGAYIYQWNGINLEEERLPLP